MGNTLHQKPQDSLQHDALKSEIWTTEEVARFLKISKRKVQRLMADGSIPFFKVGHNTRHNEFLIRQLFFNIAEEEGRE